METEAQTTPGSRSLGRILVVVGFLAFAAALFIHHRFELAGILRDVAIYPATLFTVLLVWKDRVWLCLIAAITIAVPSLAFLHPHALASMVEMMPFLNQLFLLLAAVFAGAGAGIRFLRKRR